MLKKTITYTDYNGNEQTEDFYFNLTRVELSRLDFTQKGGFKAYIERIIHAENNQKILEAFEEIVLLSYGQKSEDGRSFIKNAEATEAFKNSIPYEQLVFELLTHETAGEQFVAGIIPNDLVADHKPKQS